MKAKTIVMLVLFFLLAVVLAVIGYAAYVLIDYHRLPDWQRLEVTSVLEPTVKTSVFSWTEANTPAPIPKRK